MLRKTLKIGDYALHPVKGVGILTVLCAIKNIFNFDPETIFLFFLKDKNICEVNCTVCLKIYRGK